MAFEITVKCLVCKKNKRKFKDDYEEDDFYKKRLSAIRVFDIPACKHELIKFKKEGRING